MDTRSPQGTQSVARAALLLRLVTARAERGGARAADLVAESGLARPTVHRLLLALQAEALVDRDAVTGRWLPGPELFLMGSVAAERYDVAERSRDVVRSLATATEESAFLSVRRGDETVCLVREDGAFPIRSHVLSEGVRFPLGVASAGMAILAFLPDDEAEEFIAGHDLSGRWGAAHSRASLRSRIAETRDRGLSLNPGLIVEGSWGMGAAVFSPAGRPEWALSITGVEFRFGTARRTHLGRTLLAHAHELSQRMRHRGR
ncbi:IclR family transcriptional regulator [Microbacterium karelineae]|uniref:IclR family transcriptional regulator n=1 Tax=Microbacterium karelineae TaxID=2654283 RepID=UPI0012EA0153|nr:IclR family transcriptional regulator [Microbacterium karelineae]